MRGTRATRARFARWRASWVPRVPGWHTDDPVGAVQRENGAGAAAGTTIARPGNAAGARTAVRRAKAGADAGSTVRRGKAGAAAGRVRVGTVDGRLVLDVRGDPAAPHVLYLHGGPGLGCREFMAWQGDRLAGRLRLVGLDQRGVLRSDPLGPGAALNEADLVADCEALREMLGVRRWALLGHSFGGRVALRYARRYPERVSAVVFENPAWDWAETERLRLPVAAAIFDELGDTDAAAACRAVAAGPRHALWESIDLVGKLTGYGHYYDLYAHQPAARQLLAELAATDPYPPDWRRRAVHRGRLLLEAADAMASIVPLLTSLRPPALLIKGRYDLVTGPDQVAGFQAAVPHGRTEIFERSGHFVQMEEPDRYAELVERFVLRHARRYSVNTRA